MKTTRELDQDELAKAAALYALRGKNLVKDTEVNVTLSTESEGDKVTKIFATVTYEDDQ